MNTRISGIVASDSDFLIGFNSARQFRMPWPHDAMKEDMAFFRSTTKGSCIIVGRKTLESIGRLLPGRFHLIFSRQKQLEFCGKTIFHYSHHTNGFEKKSLETKALETKALETKNRETEQSPFTNTKAVLISGWQELEEFLAICPESTKKNRSKLFLIGGAELFASAITEQKLDDLYLSIYEAQCKDLAQPGEQGIYLPDRLCQGIRQKLQNTAPLHQFSKNAQNSYAANIYHFTNFLSLL